MTKLSSRVTLMSQQSKSAGTETIDVSTHVPEGANGVILSAQWAADDTNGDSANFREKGTVISHLCIQSHGVKSHAGQGIVPLDGDRKFDICYTGGGKISLYLLGYVQY